MVQRCAVVTGVFGVFISSFLTNCQPFYGVFEVLQLLREHVRTGESSQKSCLWASHLIKYFMSKKVRILPI